VHLAADEPAAPRVLLGRRDAGQELRPRPERRVVHAERREYPPPDEALERLARRPLEGRAEEDEPEVAVDRPAARRVLELHLRDRLDEGVAAA